jgi:hypothetical protein
VQQNVVRLLTMNQNDAVQQSDAGCVTNPVHIPGRRKRKPNPIQAAADLTIKTLIKSGATVRQAAEALQMSPSTVQRVRNEMTAEQGLSLTNGLLSPLRDENAGKLIDHFIGAGLKMKKVKGSDALGAVKIYTDRRWPTKTEHSGPSVSYVQVNIDTFRMEAPFDPSNPQSPELDITPCANVLPKPVGNE